MFYNVENLFDTFDHPAINDEEFTKDGDKAWTYYRHKQKLNNIAKTIIAVGGWEPPDVIGLCEAENFQVLMDLANESPLKNCNYQIVHENSKDSRGIDNALLFIPGKLEKIDQESIKINANGKFTTRDILYTSFQFQEKDTIHLFFNHWPSRYGGKAFTEKKRMLAANSLKRFITGFQLTNPEAKLFIM